MGERGRVCRFGAYELDMRGRELRKHGVRIKLQEQPRQILILLLEEPGEVVARDQIQKRLWPDGTFVDFDNAINSAVRKLREALNDTAENPWHRHRWQRRVLRRQTPFPHRKLTPRLPRQRRNDGDGCWRRSSLS